MTPFFLLLAFAFKYLRGCFYSRSPFKEDNLRIILIKVKVYSKHQGLPS